MILRFLIAAFVAFTVFAQTPQEVLPPELLWSGRSRALTAPPNDPWITPAERSKFRTSPGYDETVAWLRKLDASSPNVEVSSLGRSVEGREIVVVVASESGSSKPTPGQKRSRPLVFAQGGIHSGEIDGKDAGMMLLRELVHGRRRDLLSKADFVFVPIFNVDGHERSSRFGRINQRGPEVIGWRTNAQNLNLNRDYAKADTPEMRSMIAALREWDPDLYIDLHVTDGADYQYDITWAFNEPGAAWSPSIAAWLRNEWEPHVTKRLREQGHIPATMISWLDDADHSKGLLSWSSDPRFSIGYGDARHIPTVIVENHSLKPYEQRVLGTVVFLEAAIEASIRRFSELQSVIAKDRASRPERIALVRGPDTAKVETVDYLGVESVREFSKISGSERLRYTGKKTTTKTPMYPMTADLVSARRPVAYWISPAWADVIARLRIHGIAMETIDTPRIVDVEMDRLVEPRVNADTFEGHARLTTKTSLEGRKEKFPPGSVRVPTDQPLGELAMLLLEPGSPDSFLQWGFFHEILDRTEYAEAYALEPLAEWMLARDPKLAAEFQAKLDADADFRKSAWARLQWFYARSPYYDERHLLYPVARETRGE